MTKASKDFNEENIMTQILQDDNIWSIKIATRRYGENIDLMLQQLFGKIIQDDSHLSFAFTFHSLQLKQLKLFQG